MSKLNEQSGLSDDQVKSIRTFRSAQRQSKDFVQPQFEKAVRLYRLWAGVMPPEIQTTFSQIMLWFAYAAVDQELTYAMRDMLTQPDWLALVAQEVQYERTAKMATKWLKYQMQEKQQFQRLAIPAIQSSYIFGNGYRWYRYAQNTKTKYQQQVNTGIMGIPDPENPVTTIEQKITEGVICATNPNYFSVFPSPTGHEINTPEELSDERLDYLIVNFYPKKAWIQSMADQGIFDAKEVARMFNKSKSGSDSENDPAAEFKEAILDEQGKWNAFSQPSWVQNMGDEVDNTDLNPRYRVGIMFEADKWRFVAQDQYLLYDGKPWVNCTPVANFKCNISQNQFFSTGIIEPVEDLILSMILNFDMRMDHLITKFHPTKYLPEALVDQVGGDLSRFDTKPYNIIPYQHTTFRNGLQNMIHTESGEDLSQQAFIEQGQMKEYLEDIISQKGGQGLQNSTATVGQGLLNFDVARSMLRAMTVDSTGIRDSAMITLNLGAKYITEDPLIRTGAGGQPWEMIEFEAITDSYGVQINGARSLAAGEDTFKKMVSVAPMLIGDPALRGELEMKRQLIEAGGFQNADGIVDGMGGGPKNPMEAMMGQPQPQQGAQMPGGVPNFQNDAASIQSAGAGMSSGGVAGV